MTELDPNDYHSPEECGPPPSEVHAKMRAALQGCGVPHPCCVSNFALGHTLDEETGEQIGPSDLVVFYFHRHVPITMEQEFYLIQTLNDAGMPGRRLSE